jgi:hypothetical protein
LPSNWLGGAAVPAKRPEEICELFKQYMAVGDIESLLGIYDSEVVFLNQSGELKRGKEEFRQELAPLAAKRKPSLISASIKSSELATLP